MTAVVAGLTEWGKRVSSVAFCDNSVAQAWATLLDEGVCLASMSTMHRLLRLIGQGRGPPPPGQPPGQEQLECMAATRGQIWSWDITKLRGPERGVYSTLRARP